METNKMSEKVEQNMCEIWEQEDDNDNPILTKEEIKSGYKKKLQKSISSYSQEEQKKIEKQMTYDLLDSSNPYREMSNLHLGDMSKSFRWIETDVLLELIKTKLSSSEWSVFFYILHFTRGHCKNKFYRTVDHFPMDEIIEYTGLSKSSISRSIKSLEEKHMIYEVVERGIKKYGINFRYDTWISNDLS